MPIVTSGADVTIVTLVYRSTRWLDFVMEGVSLAQTDVRYRWLVVGNDATDAVTKDPRVDIDFRNDNPDEFYINRVYRAWNEGVLNAPTEWVCMINTDMWPYDGWLDALMGLATSGKAVPTSLLVESGKMPSAMPEHVKNFGRNPEEFDREGFHAHARNVVRHPSMVDVGKLFMPIVVQRQKFFDIGGYPEGNPPGTTGDKDLIRRYREAGMEHVTCLGSVVYHVQTGEQDWP